MFTLFSCSTTYENKKLDGREMISFTGESLAGQKWKIPQDFNNEPVLLLIGYKQNSQFDIDRWLIGLDMKKIDITVFEIPAIQGFFPKLFKDKIDQGMRRGIPNKLWSSVVTVYTDGDAVQKFTGNTNPFNARVLLVKNGEILFFKDEGFSVDALNKLDNLIDSLNK